MIKNQAPNDDDLGWLGRYREPRKALGAFYTPAHIAKALTDWAVRKSTDRVLDPSYGGCAFVIATIERLRTLGARLPARQTYGVDIDAQARKTLVGLCDKTTTRKNYLISDFLALESDAFVDPFDAIIGNPPFIRHHALSAAKVKVARKTLNGASNEVPLTAGYWMYFLLHSLSYLKRNGRLAMILPAAFLNAEYALKARSQLEASFAEVHSIVVQQRVFHNVQESVVFLLASGYGRAPRCSRLSIAETTDSLPEIFKRGSIASRRVRISTPKRGWKEALISDGARSLLEVLTQKRLVRQLGVLASIRIGVVTGANNFFLLDSADIARLRIPKSRFHPIVSSARKLPGIQFGRRHLSELIDNGGHSLLLIPQPNDKSRAVNAYLESDAARIARKAMKCRSREVWYDINDGDVSDAFLTYVSGRAPRLIVNSAGALCTNAIHRIWWRETEWRTIQNAFALSFLTSLTGLSAELLGRACGGGALKLEPSDASALWLVAPRTAIKALATHVAAAEEALRAREWASARALADKVFLGDLLGLTKRDICLLRDAQDMMHDLRLSGASRKGRSTHDHDFD